MDTKLYARMKKNNMRLLERNVKLQAQVAILSLTATALVGLMLILGGTVVGMKIHNSSLASKNAELEARLSAAETELAAKETALTEISLAAYELDKQVKDIYTVNQKQAEIIKTYETRDELFNHYEYALVRGDGTRTDIDYEDVSTLQSLAEEKNMGPDSVDLVLAIAMNESKGHEDVKNPVSTAAGLTGMLYGTARFVYEDEMGNGENSYEFDMVYDGALNLQMSLTYVDYLASRNGRSVMATVNGYRGLHDPGYIKNLNRYLGTQNKSLYSIEI